MQTFLPYPNFCKSLIVLDYRRAGKQRVEADQILKAINDPSYGWQNHPAVTMWRDYVPALTYYRNMSILIWKARGYNNTMPILELPGGFKFPHWLGGPIHDSHKSNLKRKDPVYYNMWPTVPDDMEYIWPERI